MSSKSKRQLLALLILGLAGGGATLMSGCAQESNSSSAFDSIYNTSFATTCANCHQPGASAYVAGTILDFSSADNAYNDLLNRGVQSVANPSQCANVRRVKAGTPTASYLLGVLSSSYNTNNFAEVSGCRPNVAHLSYSNLTSDEITAIANWISSGAAR